MGDLLTDRVVWTDTHHEVAQEEAVLAYWRGRTEGYAAGRADVEAEIRSTVERMTAGISRHRLGLTAEAVVRDLAERLLVEGRSPVAAPEIRYDDPEWPGVARPGAGATR